MRGNDQARMQLFAQLHLEFSIPCLKMRRLVQKWPAVPNPVCNAGNYLSSTDSGVAKQFSRLSCVTEQRGRSLRVRYEGWLDTEMAAELERQFAHGQRFRPGDIQDERRSLTQTEAPQAPGIRVALPNDVDLGHRKINRTSFIYRHSDVNQYSVPQLDSIIQTQKHHAGAPSGRCVLEHALAT